MSIDREQGRARTGLIVLAAFITLAAGAAAIIALRNLRVTSTPPPPALRLALLPPDTLTIGGAPDYPFGLSLAPDGRRLVFPAAKVGISQLWIRDLTTGETQALPGTEEGVLPFWAPDSRAIGFFANGRLRVITLEDAAVRDLADAPSPRGGAWHFGGDIVFAPSADGPLQRRRGSTGTTEPLTALDAAAGETSHRFPQFASGGRHLIFFVVATTPNRQGIWTAPYDEVNTRHRLTAADSYGIAVDEAVIYVHDGALLAQRLSAEGNALVAPPILLGTPVGTGPHQQLFATAAADNLIYAAPASTLRELRWLDRTGAKIGVLGEPMDAWDMRISPSGATVAVTRVDPQLGTLDIWAYDGDRPLPRRISPALGPDESAVWARDGHRLAWVSDRRGVTVRGALATLPEESLRKFEHPIRISDWSPDQQWIVVTESRPETRDDLWLIPTTPPTPPGLPIPYPNAQSTFNEMQGAISPDGRWMAYAADESGRFEIYVDSFPKPGTRARLTNGGGTEPRWRADGSELFFRRGSEIHAVKPFGANGNPEAMSSERLFDTGMEIRAFDVSAEGQRFLVNVPAADAGPQPMTVLVNVRSLLRFAP